MPRKLTHSEFMERFYERNSNANNIEILEQYKGNKIKIKCKCKICNHTWETMPNSLLSSNVNCPLCALAHRNDNKRKTHEQFMEELKERNPNINNIEILGKYKTNNKTKIECKCKICNHTWTPTANSLLLGYGCFICANRQKSNDRKKTHEQFIKELAEINPNVEVLEEYISALIKIKCRCKIDNHIWEITPNNLLNGQNCPICANKNLSDRFRKTHEQFIKELAEINPNVEVLEEYINSSTKIKCRCKIDNHIWGILPSNLLNGQGCPKCNSSKGEKSIVKYLKEHNIKFEEQYRFDNCKFKQTLPFDFYIPSLNIAIEYDGELHYKIVDWFGGLDKFIDTKIRDTIKTQYCKDHNIRLIRIPYWEFDNIEKILDEILN